MWDVVRQLERRWTRQKGALPWLPDPNIPALPEEWGWSPRNSGRQICNKTRKPKWTRLRSKKHTNQGAESERQGRRRTGRNETRKQEEERQFGHAISRPSLLSFTQLRNLSTHNPQVCSQAQPNFTSSEETQLLANPGCCASPTLESSGYRIDMLMVGDLR